MNEEPEEKEIPPREEPPSWLLPEASGGEWDSIDEVIRYTLAELRLT